MTANKQDEILAQLKAGVRIHWDNKDRLFIGNKLMQWSSKDNTDWGAALGELIQNGKIGETMTEDGFAHYHLTNLGRFGPDPRPYPFVRPECPFNYCDQKSPGVCERNNWCHHAPTAPRP
jgi:hypothetical protein